MGIADPKEFVVGPGAAPAGNPPIGPVSINCGWVSRIKKKNISQEIYAYAKRQALFGANTLFPPFCSGSTVYAIFTNMNFQF